MEDEVIENLRKMEYRLRRNDPSLTHFQPWASVVAMPFGLAMLETEEVQKALQDCMHACRGNLQVQKVTLQGIPEPELAFCLEEIAHLIQLRELRVMDNQKSQSLPIELVTLLFKQSRPLHRYGLFRNGLEKIRIAIRITVPTQRHIDELATALRELSYLQHLSLQLLPRCSIPQPNISMDPLVEACAHLPRLESLKVCLGYEHNPYQHPMVSSLQPLLQSTSLQSLQLDNFGLAHNHFVEMAGSLKHNATLKTLKVTQNPRMTAECLQAIYRVLQDYNYTLQRAVFGAQEGTNLTVIEHNIQTLTQLNQLGRGRLRQPDATPRHWIQALYDSSSSLDACYTLLRSNPSLCHLPKTHTYGLRKRKNGSIVPPELRPVVRTKSRRQSKRNNNETMFWQRL